jgi:hypothetical protein
MGMDVAMDWVPLDRYAQGLEPELGDRWCAERETRSRLYRGELIARGRRAGETATGWVAIPRGWWRPSSGLIGVSFVDYALCTMWMNTIRGSCDAYVDVQVREASAKLDVSAAIRQLHAEGARPGRGGMAWKDYQRAIKQLSGRRYDPRHLRRLIPKALADRTSESEEGPKSPVDLAGKP